MQLVFIILINECQDSNKHATGYFMTYITTLTLEYTMILCVLLPCAGDF